MVPMNASDFETKFPPVLFSFEAAEIDPTWSRNK
jgi:hypothetical protein